MGGKVGCTNIHISPFTLYLLYLKCCPFPARRTTFTQSAYKQTSIYFICRLGKKATLKWGLMGEGSSWGEVLVCTLGVFQHFALLFCACMTHKFLYLCWYPFLCCSKVMGIQYVRKFVPARYQKERRWGWTGDCTVYYQTFTVLYSWSVMWPSPVILLMPKVGA